MVRTSTRYDPGGTSATQLLKYRFADDPIKISLSTSAPAESLTRAWTVSRVSSGFCPSYWFRAKTAVMRVVPPDLTGAGVAFMLCREILPE